MLKSGFDLYNETHQWLLSWQGNEKEKKFYCVFKKDENVHKNSQIAKMHKKHLMNKESTHKSWYSTHTQHRA